MTLEIVRTVRDLRERVDAFRREGATIGMVPTMGALHDGHLALIRAALAETDRAVVTLFVNPAQFSPTEDLAAYPRDEDADRVKIAELGAHLLFAPPVSEIYPQGFSTRIVVGGPATGLESAFRPEHFSGVATVVAKLLLAGSPDRAFFGEKDYQQLLVVRQMVRDLGIRTSIVGCPTAREADGLALSSRNVYLSPEERARAPLLYATLQDAARRLRQGESEPAVLGEAKEALSAAGFAVDYFEARNAETLAPINDLTSEPVRLLTAARVGRTRLIDNVAV